MKVSEAIDVVTSGSFSAKRLARGIEHVSKLWMPINPDIFERIKRGLQRGEYQRNREALVEDLKSDIALFAWCLKCLCQMVESDPDHDPNFDPLKHLETVELEALQEILNVDVSDISTHDLKSSDDEQMRALREVILGATTAEMLSDSRGVDRKRAYGAALLRQLGMTLIAWNYPSVFKEVMEEVKQGQDMDTAFSKRLGFSPSLFATKLVQHWGVSEKKCLSLGLYFQPGTTFSVQDRTDGNAPEQDESEYIREICEIGEVLAQANDPERYPHASEQWGTMERKIKDALGERGIAKVREQFEENCAGYARFNPKILSGQGEMYDHQKYPHTSNMQSALRKNKYIESCAIDVQLRLKKLYRAMSDTVSIDQEHIRTLVRETIPAAGFTGGCVFTMDPTLAKFMPQLKFGEVLLRKIKPVDYSVEPSHADLVAAAYQSLDPKTHLETADSGELRLAIAGVVGRTRRFGVLYLECDVNKITYDNEQRILHFKAVSRALNDALNLH